MQWKPNFQSPTKPSAAETCKLNWFSNAVFDLEPTKWIHKKVQNIAVSSTRNSSSTARVSCKFKRFLQASNSFIRSLLRCTTGAFDYSYTPQYSMDHDMVRTHYYALFPLLINVTDCLAVSTWVCLSIFVNFHGCTLYIKCYSPIMINKKKS